MHKFSHSFLNEIRARILPSEVVRRSVVLKKNGREYSGLCPFHKEKTPSFTVNDEKGFYHCFGCGAHGDAIRFLTDNEGLPYPEAVQQLASMAGLEVPKNSPAEDKREAKRASLYDVMQLAAGWFVRNLHTNDAIEARKYLIQRGLNKQVIDIFSLGFAPAKRNHLRTFLASKNITDAQMLECGLLAKNDKGEVYDKFRNRIIFPIRNVKGQVIAFGGRAIGDAMPKYLNSPETILFKKRDNLYNEDLARKASFKTGRLVVTEGYMDVIIMYMSGIKEVVAPLGTAITDVQLQRMWRLSDQPIICLDGDKAGQKAMKKTADLAVPELLPGKTLKFVQLPDNMDPDDIIRSYGVNKIADILSKARSLSEYIWTQELTQIDLQSPESRALLEKNLYECAGKIKDSSVMHHYRNFFQEKLRAIMSMQRKSPKAPIDDTQRITQIDKLPNIDIRSRNGVENLIILIIIHNVNLLQDTDILEEFINIEFVSIKLDKIRTFILEMYNGSDLPSSENVEDILIGKGFKGEILYLNNLGIYQNVVDQRHIRDNNGNVKDYWAYAICIYNLARLKEEYRLYSSTMTEEAEKKAKEIYAQILHNQDYVVKIEADLIEGNDY